MINDLLGNDNEKDDSISLEENTEFMIRDKSQLERIDELSSNRNKLLFDDEDIFRNLATTMRNPRINNHNILDTLAEYRNLNQKR